MFFLQWKKNHYTVPYIYIYIYPCIPATIVSKNPPGHANPRAGPLSARRWRLSGGRGWKRPCGILRATGEECLALTSWWALTPLRVPRSLEVGSRSQSAGVWVNTFGKTWPGKDGRQGRIDARTQMKRRTSVGYFCRSLICLWNLVIEEVLLGRLCSSDPWPISPTLKYLLRR